LVATPEKSLAQIRRELLLGAGGLAHSARRVFRWRATLWWIALGTAVLVLLLIVDMWLRREEVGLRVLSVLTWIVTLAVGAYYWLRPAWRFSPTPVEVARWIELSQPQLGQQLSTALELATLPAHETRYGSPAFRDCALRQWSSAGHVPNWRKHLDTGGLRRAAWLSGALLTLLIGLCWVRPEETGVAFARLTLPWSDTRWPQRDQLLLRDPPSVVAVGTELQLEVIDQRPPLPERVEVQTRLVDGRNTTPQSTPQSTLDTIQVGELAVANLPSLSTTIEVRAVGGDDRGTPWHRIQVVKPPELNEYQFRVEPPAYSRLAPAEVVGRRIAVLAGSQVSFLGSFSEPVKQVTVVGLSSPAGSSDVSPAESSAPTVGAEQVSQAAAQLATDTRPLEWSAHVGSDQRAVRLGDAAAQPVRMEQSLSWQLSVVTATGLKLQLPQRWQIEVTQDAPPVVAMQAAELAELSADARLALQGMATDDLGLEELVARLRVEGLESAEPFRLPIWSAPAANPSDSQSIQQVRELKVDAPWSLAPTIALKSGQRISVWLEARDNAGQWGRSATREYAIRDPQELVQSIQQRQDQLLHKVRELVDTQRRNSQLFSRAAELASNEAQLDREQLDLYRNVAQVQRALLRQFSSTGAQAGLSQDVGKLRELLEQNRLDTSELAQELASLQSTIAELEAGPLRAATDASEQSLQQAQAVQTASNDEPTLVPLRETNERTAQAQDKALRGLESLLDRLARNEALQQVQRELAQILNQQNALRRETDQLQLQRLSNADQDQQRAAQTALSADQQGLARRVDDLVRRAEELRAAASQDQQTLKTQLERAVQTLVNSQTSAEMRQATDELRSEKFAQASTTQQKVAELLEQTLQQLGAGNSTQLGSLQNRAEGLRQTGQSLAQLAEEQADLSSQWDAAQAALHNEQLLAKQNQLTERTQSQADSAVTAGDASLANELQSALSDQQLAEQAGQQKSFEQAAQAARRAAEQLEQSAEQLQQRAEQLEQQVAERQMSELSEALQHLATLQLPVTEQIGQLPEPTLAEEREMRQAAIRNIAQQQEAVRQNLREVRTKTSQLPTFDWTLQQAETSMSRAVAAAQRYRLRPDAQLAADDALRLLELALDAMQQVSSAADNPPSQPTEQDADGPSDNPATPPRPVPVIASLKLLRSLQQEINERTAATEQSNDASRRSQRLNELSSMQQALGEQIEQLLREFAAANDTGEN
jgi:hypothetical protein